MKTINVNFDNVVTEQELPLNDNVKIIYAFRDTVNSDNNTWVIKNIMYIGKSIDASGRLNSNHEKIQKAKTMLQKGHFLTFSYCIFLNNITDKQIREIENALIFRIKPILNEDNKCKYNYEPITVIIGGKKRTGLPEKIVIANEDVNC